jgi:NAD(P)H-hydrate repair Nnr-like enzyme with NAD(P)H-hydrate dehydratase domain
MILSFLSQGYTPYQAAQLAVYLHGLAADLTLNRQSMESMLITDVIENLGAAFQSLDV